ncbi:ATP-dependent helicase HrpB [Spongiibacter sp. KMU-166]|uniref:ATP-dependent helicase HrpB n=1 Tax=Spongiibacter thalassae TaxID=2721624 RepID=A0ABX1GF28_9GAMM|nr:ATP-dependent helicase HrpB [Spongiibacter thalassae]NKI17546.1 ATP-dependent helicase HrpB [Spongiibacter thalassae]
MSESLPIFAQLPALREALRAHHCVVLEAPPGAGKTTQVPLAMLDEPWLAGRKILMLEPRRLAARGAAERMASQLGERAGDTVGYRVRMESRVSSATRIEVITEGILARMLNDDPALSEVGLLIFDEFHERNLDADLGLALTLEGQRLFGELREAPLKVVLMSATLNGGQLSAYLGDAPLLRSEGRQFPVTKHYVPPPRGRVTGQSGSRSREVLSAMPAQIRRALADHEGNILVFLPGQREIQHIARALQSETASQNIVIAPLYGSLGLDAQRRAIAAPEPGWRKVVLATDIAESSLTIDGITVVIDSGLRRQALFDPRSGIVRLADTGISTASAEQRAGRAGRVAPGVCYRMWPEEQSLADFAEPEILTSELSTMVLQCLRWGIDPRELPWIDPPPAAHLDQARDLLVSLGALVAPGDDGRSAPESGTVTLTPLGEAMSDLPVAPRLARLLLSAKAVGCAGPACDIAALLSERDIASSQTGVDVSARLQLLRAGSEQDGRIRQIRRQSQQYARLLDVERDAKDSRLAMAAAADPARLAVLIAEAFPDRIARCRQTNGVEYQLSNGRAATIGENDPLRGNEFLAVLELSGREGDSRDVIRLAAPLAQEAFEGRLAPLVRRELSADWDDSKGRFVAQQLEKVGKLLLNSTAVKNIAPEQRQQAVFSLLRRRGLGVLSWRNDDRQLRARIALLASCACRPGGWPDVADEGLLRACEARLSSFFDGVGSLRDLQKVEVKQLLLGLLSWEQQQALAREAPEAIAVPSGSRIRVDYTQSPPVLAVKLQEMFGCETTPCVAEGRQPLLIHLLSPARRPLQVTSDLAGFWRSSYHDVKKDMKGRYPRHPWPDDPLVAKATAYTKRRAADT